MLITLKENILYQQILLDYFTNKIKDENIFAQKLSEKGLDSGFGYRKVAYVTLSVNELIPAFAGEEAYGRLAKIIIDNYSGNEIAAIPLYFSANEVKLCVISFNDITFEKNLGEKNTEVSDAISDKFGVKLIPEIKGVFATLKELKLNLCSLIFDSFPKIKADSQLILRAKVYIEKNYMNKISLNDIAKYLGITSYYFCRVFKKETGVNFANYLTEVRLDQAKKLLKETKLSNKVICEKVGINSTNYFHQLFKNYTGMTPSEFKRMK